MFPGRFIDGTKETDEKIISAPGVEKVAECPGNEYKDCSYNRIFFYLIHRYHPILVYTEAKILFIKDFLKWLYKR